VVFVNFTFTEVVWLANLDAPAGVVEIGEVGGGIGVGVQQRGHDGVDPAVGCHHPDQADRRRLARHRLGLAGTQEAPDLGETGGIHPQTEVNAALPQGGDQP